MFPRAFQLLFIHVEAKQRSELVTRITLQTDYFHQLHDFARAAGTPLLVGDELQGRAALLQPDVMGMLKAQPVRLLNADESLVGRNHLAERGNGSASGVIIGRQSALVGAGLGNEQFQGINKPGKWKRVRRFL